MDIMSNGKGIGRGRGRGKPLFMQNGLIMDFALPPINPPKEHSSITNGMSIARGRGRGNGVRPQALMLLVPAPICQPNVALDSGRESPPRISEEDLKALRKLLNGTIQTQANKKPISEQRSLCKLWTYPRGITRPLLILSMNEYLTTKELFIPGEISIAPFNLKEGMDLRTTYWTLVDPSKDIPPDLNNNATNTVVNSRYYQNYKKIVEDMEAFIQATSEPIPNDQDVNGDTHVIFCQKEFLSGYTSGLNWLYNLAGKEKFPHKLVALESVLVMLSHGGIRNQAERKGFGEQTFPQVLTSFSHAVDTIAQRYMGVSAPTSNDEIEMMNAEVQFILSKLRGCFVSRTRFTQYITIGERGARLAGRRVVEHPQAFLGAFLSEGQAARYLKQMDYTNKDNLACAYHKATEQKGKCARFNVARMIYTALDVLLANYEIEPKEGRHFPEYFYYTILTSKSNAMFS